MTPEREKLFALLLAKVEKMRAAQRAPYRDVVYYAPGHKEDVEGYERDVDVLVRALTSDADARPCKPEAHS